ncbi:hypothetical protein HEO90_021030, partial [Escherichia coli]|nr:hypothetical protein [Escherichia coli]
WSTSKTPSYTKSVSWQHHPELNAGTRVLENALVPPMGESTVKLPSDAGSNITYRTINDYGALTPKMTGVME